MRATLDSSALHASPLQSMDTIVLVAASNTILTIPQPPSIMIENSFRGCAASSPGYRYIWQMMYFLPRLINPEYSRSYSRRCVSTYSRSIHVLAGMGVSSFRYVWRAVSSLSRSLSAGIQISSKRMPSHFRNRRVASGSLMIVVYGPSLPMGSQSVIVAVVFVHKACVFRRLFRTRDVTDDPAIADAAPVLHGQ